MPQQTNFPQMPPRYWPILDAYLAYVRSQNRQPEGAPEWHPQSHLGPAMRQSWNHGARQLYEELSAAKIPESEHAEFVQWACRQMDKLSLMRKSPRSLIFLVGDWRDSKGVMWLFGEAVEYEDEPMVICDKCEQLVYEDRVEEGLCLDCRTLLGWEESYMKVSV